MNEELTNLLKGHTISGTSDSNGEKTVTFDDGCKLSLKTAPSSSNSATTGGEIEAAKLEADDTPRLMLHLNDGGVISFDLASATGSVTVRDADGNTTFES